MKSVSPGLYQSPDGAYFVRPWIKGRRTWRKLRAVKLRAAIIESAAADWTAPAGTFAELCDLYTAAHCPNRKLQPRPESFTTAETARCTRLKSFFGNLPAGSIRLADLPRYHAWRTRKPNLRFGTGNRTVDKDLATLSNILNYGVATSQLAINYVARGRPRYQEEKAIRHSRAVAPASADVIHQLAAHFLASVPSEVFAWQALFAAFTGCRTSELLRLRLDAPNDIAPGYIEGNMLFLARSKNGVNPWSEIGPEFAEMLRAFRHWHASRFPRNPHYFPGRYGKSHVDLGAFGHALTRASGQLGLPKITPHGFRSFYVTKRRGDGASDVQIAGEIGDRTVLLMQSTYGGRPKNWRGEKPMTWLPENSLPAWQSWLPTDPCAIVRAQVDYKLDYAENPRLPNPLEVVEEVVAGDGIEPPTQGFSGTSSLVRKSPPATIANDCGLNAPAELRDSAPLSHGTGLSTGL